MRTLSRPLVVLGILLVLLVATTGSVAHQLGSKREARAMADRAVARNPLAFQPEGTSRFVARTPGYGVAVSPEGATVSGAGRTPLRLRLDGANPTAGATGRDRLSGRSNMFLGDDPSAWQTDVTTFGQVAYDEVWNGIDVVWHGNGAHLEQDFVVAPRADPDQIGLSFPDARTVAVGDGGDLIVHLSDGDTRLGAPTLYQDLGSGRRSVPGAFVVRGGGVVGFTIGAHDTAKPLVIDPVLVQSSYLGGGGSDAGYGIAVDAGGNVYVTGSTESVDFPVAGPVQNNLMQVNEVRTDAFVAKIKADGSGFAYSTYLGGKGRDIGYGIAVSFDGSAYVSGSTESPDFPTARPVQKAFGGGTTDAFVTKLGPQGAVLAYSTYLGGGGNDLARGVAVDGAGNAYVVGITNSNDFPTAGPPLQGAPNKPDDTAAFVTSVNVAGSAWNYSTYLGGSGDDRAMAVAVDPAGEAFVTGDTRSADFPLVRPLQATPGSPLGIGAAKAESFLVKLPVSGAPLVYSTYLGGSGSDLATGVAVDLDGAAYVTGTTESTNFPLVKPLQAARGGGFDAFVSKVDPGGGALVYSTFLGGTASDAGAGITVTADDQASVTGTSASDNFPVAKAVKGAKAGFVDAFVATLTPSGAGLVQSTYLGGRDDDNATAITADRSGTLYFTGYTRSADFPLVTPLKPVMGGTDAFVATVGDRPTDVSGAAGSPARDRRIRTFGVVTALLFLAAFAQTLWLRRRGSPDVSDPAPAIPAMVVIGSASQAEPDWYRPKAPRLSDLPPPRPRAVPVATPKRSRKKPALAAGETAVKEPARADVTGGDVTGGVMTGGDMTDGDRTDGDRTRGDRTSGDMAVPDLFPASADVDWSRAQEPDDADFWLTDDLSGDKAAPRSVDVQAPDLWGPVEAEEVAAEGPWGSGSEDQVDVQAPDLWGPADSDEDLAIDPLWAELLAGPAPGPLAPADPAEPQVPGPEAITDEPSPAPAPKRRPSKSTPRKSTRRPQKPETSAAEAEPAQAEPAASPSDRPPPSPEPEPRPSKSTRAKAGRRPRSQASAPAPELEATPEPEATPVPEPATAPPQSEPQPSDAGTTTGRDWIAELWPEKPLRADEAKATLGDDVLTPESAASTAGGDAGASGRDGSAPTSGEVDAPAVEAQPRGWRARRRAKAAKRDRHETAASSEAAVAADADDAVAPPPAPVTPEVPPTPELRAQPTSRRRRSREAPPADSTPPTPPPDPPLVEPTAADASAPPRRRRRQDLSSAPTPTPPISAAPGSPAQPSAPSTPPEPPALARQRGRQTPPSAPTPPRPPPPPAPQPPAPPLVEPTPPEPPARRRGRQAPASAPAPTPTPPLVSSTSPTPAPPLVPPTPPAPPAAPRRRGRQGPPSAPTPPPTPSEPPAPLRRRRRPGPSSAPTPTPLLPPPLASPPGLPVPAPVAVDPPVSIPDPVPEEPGSSARSEFARPVPEPTEPPKAGVEPDWEGLVVDGPPSAETDTEPASPAHDKGPLIVTGSLGILDIDRDAVEAGLADLVGNVELADLPDDALAATLDESPGIAPLDDPAVADALAHELSISDLLAEDLAIPESAVDRDELSLRELLAEDLTVPDTEEAVQPAASAPEPGSPPADDRPVPEEPARDGAPGRAGPDTGHDPLAAAATTATTAATTATTAATTAAAAAAATTAGSDTATFTRPDDGDASTPAPDTAAGAHSADTAAETGGPPAAAPTAPGDSGHAAAHADDRSSTDTDRPPATPDVDPDDRAKTDPDKGGPPDEPPPEPRCRQLPEAKPGVMRGLRAGWNKPRQ